MYIRIGSVVRRKRLLIILYPKLPSLFASEICRENRRLQNDVEKLRRLVDRTRNEISNQDEIAGKILDDFLKEKSEVFLKHRQLSIKNQQLREGYRRLQNNRERLKRDLDMVTEHLENMGNRSPSSGQNNTVEKNLDAILKEKSGDIHRRNAVVVSRFYKAAFTVLTSYTSLCGLSFICGGQSLFPGLVGVATTALILSCVNALHQVNKNGEKLQQVKHAQSLLPRDFFSRRHRQVEPSIRLVLRLVWRDMLQILVVAILAAVYLLYLAFYMHKERCSTKLLSHVFSILG